MTTTPNMSLILPDVGSTVGPTYATLNNSAFSLLDTHDHTAGNGIRVPSAGINIDSDLTFSSNDATSLRSARFDDHAAVLSTSADKGCVYFVNGNFYINNAAGTAVQITDGTGINIASTGTIGGDYGQPGVTANATYSDTTKTFTWTQASGITAKMAMGDILLHENISSANAVTIKSPTSLGSAITITTPDVTGTLVTAGGIETISGAWTHSGNVTISSANLTSASATITGSWAGTPTWTGNHEFSASVGIGGITPTVPLHVNGVTQVEEATQTAGPVGVLGVGKIKLDPLVTQEIDNTSGAATGDYTLEPGIYLITMTVLGGGHRRTETILVGGSQFHSGPVVMGTSILNTPSTLSYTQTASALRIQLNADNTQGRYDVAVSVLGV